jgi:hypothetical protein
MPHYDSGALYDSGLRYADGPVVPVVLTQKKKGRIMATNAVPDTQDELLSLAEDMADGLHTDGAGAGVAQNTEAVMRATIAALRTAEAEFGTAKDARQAAVDGLQAADDQAREFLLATKRVLSQFLGTRWSTAWEPTGFPDLSTAVPTTQEKRMNLCASLKIYFTNNPAREVAAMGVTAALADERFEALSDGRDAVEHKTREQGVKKDARDAALVTMKKRARGLIEELSTLLADNDRRWHAFGLSMPADPDTPEPVTALRLTPGTAGVIVASWPRAVRATRYRPFVQIVGVDEKPVAREAVTMTEVNLRGFTSGQTVKVYIVAANDAGEAAEGPTEQILVP